MGAVLNQTTAQEFSEEQIALGTNFLLVGSDAFLIDSVVDRIRISLRQQNEVDLVIIYGDEIKSAQLLDLLDAYSVFSNAKLILLRNAEALKKKELDTLADYIKQPADIQTLVLVAEKTDLKFTAWKTIREKCVLVACDPPRFAGQIRPWLDGQLQRLGKSMTPAASETFISRIELDYANASNELQKLVLLTLDRPQITEQDVLRCIGTSRVGTLIDFYRALGSRQTRSAMDLLQRMLSSDWETLQVFFQISRFYQIIYRILLLKKDHISPAEIVRSHLGELFATQKQEFVNFTNNYSLPEVREIFGILLETDARIKLTAAEGNILLSLCLLKALKQ